MKHIPNNGELLVNNGELILQAAQVYINAWRPESSVQHEPEKLDTMLGEVVAPGGLTYLAGGLV